MARIVFIGAGSLGFTRNLVRDVLTFDTLKDAQIVLMDINPERLDFAARACQTLIDRGNYPAKIIATLDRQEAIKGADAVICTILNGDVEVWRHDIEIPKKYGIDTNVGDTRSISGMFRALRTIPVLIDIARDVERLAPRAIMLNYTNPMAMLCRAVQREVGVPITGLCHSVQGTAEMLAKWVGVKYEELDYVCAGINHQAWYLRLEHHGKNLYPALRQKIAGDEKIYHAEFVRNEMFLALDYYVTESSGHNSEYNWWFRKRPELIAQYCSPIKDVSEWNPGEYAFILNGYLKKSTEWQDEVKKWFDEGAPFDLNRGKEYAAYIMNAWLGGEPFEFNGNVPNTGLIENLPRDACVEVPVLVNRRGFNPMHVGKLPPQLAALNNVSVSVEEMTVEAALTGDAKLVYQAACYDPLTAAVLSLAEIKKLVKEMLEKNQPWLPAFKNLL